MRTFLKSRNTSKALLLFLDLTIRETRSKALGKGAGWFWVVISPLMLLMAYGFVFGVLFQSRVPNLEVPFVAWLAVGLWPWLAFSDAIQNGARAIEANAALISKVSFPRVLLTASYHSSAFFLQLCGFCVVILVLTVFGLQLTWLALPHLLFLLISLYLFSLGIALTLSAAQVFIPDIQQALPNVLTFWFFFTPIIYSPELLPGEFRMWLYLNPLAWWMQEIRGALFEGHSMPDMISWLLFVLSVLVVIVGYGFFKRVSPFFEDIL